MQEDNKTYLIELITNETNLSNFNFTQLRNFKFMTGKIPTGYRCLFNNEKDYLDALQITQQDTRYSNLNWKYIIVNNQEKFTETRYNLDPLKYKLFNHINPINPTPTEFNKSTLLNRDILYRTNYRVYELDRNYFVMTKCKIIRVNKLTLTLKKYNAIIDLSNFTDTTPKEDRIIIFNWKDTINEYEPIFYIHQISLEYLLQNKMLSFIDENNFCGFSKYSDRSYYSG
jgi:hypothetical protein